MLRLDGQVLLKSIEGTYDDNIFFEMHYFQSQQKEDDQEMAGHFTRMAARSRDLRHSSNQEFSAYTYKTY